MKIKRANYWGATALCGVLLTSISTARGAVPAGRYMVNAGTVYDTKTKLTWQQTVTPTTYAFSDAINYCASMGVSLGGAGWRIPTIKELQTIVDYSQTSAPWIDRTAFPSTPVHYFWSSTAQAGTTTHWVLDFSVGNITVPGMSTANNVRCVH
ncbi:MAG TPA: DUF1566 domain-containing protein [Polyangia bacterium]|nr:DUF1566 domain-containing protein [Polyangia bacterium]